MLDIFANKIFLAVVLSAILSQSIKLIFHAVKDKRFPSLLGLIVTGGMPSTHCSMVSSLLATLFLVEGISVSATISLVLFIVVVTDSMGVRRTAGEDAIMLNQIISLEKLKLKQMHYSLGHKPIEVFMGVLIGFIVSIIIFVI